MSGTQPTVSATGTASRWAGADHADLGLTVTGRGETSADAVAAAFHAYGVLDGLLAADVVARRTTVALSVRPVVRWDQTNGIEVQEGYAASRTETVRLVPPREANALLAALTSQVPDLTIDGPRFGLDPGHPVHDEARAAAAADARRGAAAFAGGLGLALGEVVDVTEPSGNDSHDTLAVADAAFKMRGGGADEGALVVEMVDQDVEVRSRVVVRFNLVSPLS